MSRLARAVAGACFASLAGHGCSSAPAQLAPAPSPSCIQPALPASLPESLSVAMSGADCAAPLRYVRGADARDLIDDGVDVLVTGDADVLAYAAARPDLVSLPLPWSRTYLLVRPRRAPADSASPRAAELGVALARDAVRAEARAAEPPYWWESAGPCDAVQIAPVPPVARPPGRVVYRRGDRVARGLAERLVALGWGAIAAGLGPPEFDASLRAASERAYVVDLPTEAPTPCDELRALPARADLLPLIQTRRRAIVRSDRYTASMGEDGSIRLTTLSPPPPAPAVP